MAKPIQRVLLVAFTCTLALSAGPPADAADRSRSQQSSASKQSGCSKYSGRRSVVNRVPKQIRQIVDQLAPEYGLDPLLVYSVIAVESNFKTKAVSHANAQGLMQLIPATAKRFGVRNSFDPKQNVRGGMKYLRWLLKKFKGNVDHALAGYNAGEGAVMKYRGIPPYRETKAYVKKIRRIYGCGGGGGVIGEESIRLASAFFGGLEMLGEELDAVSLDDVRGDGGLSLTATPISELAPGQTDIGVSLFD